MVTHDCVNDQDAAGVRHFHCDIRGLTPPARSPEVCGPALRCQQQAAGGFEVADHVVQEPRGGGAVDQAVIGGFLGHPLDADRSPGVVGRLAGSGGKSPYGIRPQKLKYRTYCIPISLLRNQPPFLWCSYPSWLSALHTRRPSIYRCECDAPRPGEPASGNAVAARVGNRYNVTRDTFVPRSRHRGHLRWRRHPGGSQDLSARAVAHRTTEAGSTQPCAGPP